MFAAAFDPDGRTLATGGSGGTSLWDADSGKLRNRLASNSCNAVTFSPHSRILASMNGLHVTLWELSTGSALCRITGHNSMVHSMAFDCEGDMLATGGDTVGTVRLWAIPSGQCLRVFDGHSEMVTSVALDPGGGILASAGFDRTIRLWDVATGGTVSILEGHTDVVWALSFSGDGRVLTSNSADGTVRLWETDSGQCRAVLPAFALGDWMQSVAFHPHLPILAAVGPDVSQSSTQVDPVVHLWELDVDRLLAHSATPSVSYTTSKIVLVGESGVGKTGLGWRLAHGEFVEHASTHGQQFWLLDELGGTGADGTKREAILWDLAGQPDYRLTHALYLDDADLALVLFDPTHGDDPLRGVEYWLRQLGRHRPIVLVAARGDRGAPRLTTEEIGAFCAERGLAGYVVTSALR
jgi:WD40 repeat protein